MSLIQLLKRLSITRRHRVDERLDLGSRMSQWPFLYLLMSMAHAQKVATNRWILMLYSSFDDDGGGFGCCSPSQK